MKYSIRGLNKSGTRFICEDVEAESEGEAYRIVRRLHPDAGALSCRPPNHRALILETLANRNQPERIAACLS